jgi:hypothetical protein
LKSTTYKRFLFYPAKQPANLETACAGFLLVLRKYNVMRVWLTKIRCPLLDNQAAGFVAGAGCGIA